MVAMSETGPKVVVMGVSGCGKTRIGEQLAAALEVPFFDADAFHSDRNIQKMADGIPLTDSDRAGWLEDLATLIADAPTGLVLACSALKVSYRDHLRTGSGGLRFVYLEGDQELIWQRLSAREDHYFSGRQMLASQFATLEPPRAEPDVLALNVDARVANACGGGDSCLHVRRDWR